MFQGKSFYTYAPIGPAIVTADDVDKAYSSGDLFALQGGHGTFVAGLIAAGVGNGIGIAIVDSGIYNAHTSFIDTQTGQSRIVVNQDFTGEGRTDEAVVPPRLRRRAASVVVRQREHERLDSR